ncbi:MAG: hypothetical protein WC758_08440 [Candidatus Woesearchaeota archaeon]|jgi:hypothetical protein
MTKINIKLICLSITLIFLIGIVSAETAQYVSPSVSPLTAFFNNLFHSQTTFSVVGDSRSCGTSGGNANYVWSVDAGKKLDGSQGVLSGSVPTSLPTNYLVDIFIKGWTPLVEKKSFDNWICGENDAPCNIQIYACPTVECTSSSCGSGKTCNSIICPILSGTSYYQCPTESNIPYYTNSYSYCTQSNTMKCYYQSGNDCGSRTYDKSLFPNSCESYNYNNQKLYSDYTTCKNTICIPNLCASTTCNGQTCGDGCGNYQIGTKDCSVTPGENVNKGDIVINGEVSLSFKLSTMDTPETINVPVKNFGSATETVNIEGGFYSSAYAKDTAKLYAISNQGSIVSTPNCNPAEDFVKTQQVTLAPGESAVVKISVVPSNALKTYSIGKHNLQSEPLVWFAGIYKECLKGYTNEAGSVGKGVMFDYGNFGTYCQFSFLGIGDAGIYCNSEQIGTCERKITQNDILTLDKTCAITLTTDVIQNKTTATQSVVSPALDIKSAFSWAAWFDINGDGKADGTDGMIIIFGIFIGLIILTSIGSKK